MFTLINMNNKKVKKGFSLPEVIIAITILVLIIVTATNLLISSMGANVVNTNKIIAYNLAQEAIEGLRNIRDNNWIHNQYWRGSEKRLFGVSFEDDGKYIIRKNHNLKTVEECRVLKDQSNTVSAVQNAAPWQLSNYTENESQLYMSEDGVNEYTHQPTNKTSKFRRYLEIETIPYDLATSENEDQLKISVTAVVEWLDKGEYEELRVSTILTDWKAGPL